MRFLFVGWFSATAECHYSVKPRQDKLILLLLCFTSVENNGKTIYQMTRKRWLISWIALWPIAFIFFLYPINDRPLRIGLIISLLGLWIGCLYFGWRNRLVRFGLLLCTAVTAGFLICPGRSYETITLRTAYTQSLRSYEGTRYVWGGENKLGIDCSGLVRAGLIKASLEQGLATLNPGLVRHSLLLWWHDSTAKALGEEYGSDKTYSQGNQYQQP